MASLKENVKLGKLFELFNGLSVSEKWDTIERLLLENDFTSKEVKSRKCTTYYFYKEEVVNIFVFTCNSKGDTLELVIPKDFAEEYYTNEKGEYCRIIRLNGHSNKNREISAVLDTDEQRNAKLHRVLLEWLDYGLYGYVVDHICRHQGINVPEELRVCCVIQNNENRKINGNSKQGTRPATEYDYDSERDFKESFWIPVLHYVLGMISSEDMRTLRKMELGTYVEE